MRSGDPVHFQINGQAYSAVVDRVVFQGGTAASPGATHQQLLVLRTQHGSILARDRIVQGREEGRRTQPVWTIYSSDQAFASDADARKNPLWSRAVAAWRRQQQAREV